MKEITIRQITTRFKNFLDPSKTKVIDMDDPFVKPNTINTRRAVVGDLNRRGPYRRDGIIFVPSTFDKATTVFEAVEAIKNVYKSAGFKVTLGL